MLTNSAEDAKEKKVEQATSCCSKTLVEQHSIASITLLIYSVVQQREFAIAFLPFLGSCGKTLSSQIRYKYGFSKHNASFLSRISEAVSYFFR
jgi:hypothetical protein